MRLAYQGYGAVHSEKAKVFQAMWPLNPDDLVRGQYGGYLDEPGVANDSDVEMPYERLLSDAMADNGALFTREDAVEAAWAVVDPVLETRPEAQPYEPGTWGPTQADAPIAANGNWHTPARDEAPT